MSTDKPHRIRVKVVDGKPREPNQVKGQLVPHVDVIDAKGRVEFVICAVKPDHLEQVRAKLAAAGLDEIPGGDTAVSNPGPPSGRDQQRGAQRPQRFAPQDRQSTRMERPKAVNLHKKPYGFVPLPDTFSTAEPVWHDGTCSTGRLSGEIRFEMETLTPLLVGWERRRIDDKEGEWPIHVVPVHGSNLDTFLDRAARKVHPDLDAPNRQRDVERARRVYIDGMQNAVVEIPGAGRTISSKSLLCPLRAPWSERPVVIPGDSLKGLLRHELGALLGAPMERVAERSYSYRPNSLYPSEPNPRLIPRIAQVPKDGVELRRLDPSNPRSPEVRVPVRLDLLADNLRYDPHHNRQPPRYRFDAPGGAPYHGGLGARETLNSRRPLHTFLRAEPVGPTTRVSVPHDVQEGYLHTIRHLTDLEHGHFSERHPDVPNRVTGEQARDRIREAARNVVFQPGDLIWVEWDREQERVVSFGWHYYYRWAYQDTVRRKGWRTERMGLFPLDEEKNNEPRGLSPVRRLFGYINDNDNEGNRGIGKDDHEQLMGRISVNAALEDVVEGTQDNARFLRPIFLKELGMPRPSAVEFYLAQPHYPNERPSDRATLITYGDAAGYDTPGQLAGRKFYLDHADAYTGEPWKDDSEANRLNERSTLVLDASRPGRRFRFTVRFRDLDAEDLAAILLALCPNQFAQAVGGLHTDGYCSKLGYARPLGWGSVRIQAKEMHLLHETSTAPKLAPIADLMAWFRQHFQRPPCLNPWLSIHRHKHPDADDYPREKGNIYTFHANQRAQHARWRRYDREGS